VEPGHAQNVGMRNHVKHDAYTEDTLGGEAPRRTMCAEAVHDRRRVLLARIAERHPQRHHRQQRRALPRERRAYPESEQLRTIHQEHDRQRKEQRQAIAVELDPEPADGADVPARGQFRAARTCHNSELGHSVRRREQQLHRQAVISHGHRRVQRADHQRRSLVHQMHGHLHSLGTQPVRNVARCGRRAPMRQVNADDNRTWNVTRT
jgi:hypothetical protein